MKVLVFGCGPAGLMAAHAAAMGGHDVVVMSRRRKSFMRGAQYLHAPIPGASKVGRFEVRYQLFGSSAVYRDKVYGPNSRVDVSPETLDTMHHAWDIREAYDWLWETYGGHVTELEIASGNDIEQALLWAKPDVAISTVPAPSVCRVNEHQFGAEKVWATEIASLIVPPEDNLVLCSGDRGHAWYRQSRIQGWTNTEYPERSKPPLSSDRIHSVVKPITTNCDCFPGVIRMGRYGEWKKGVLSHEAFFRTAKILSGPQQEMMF